LATSIKSLQVSRNPITWIISLLRPLDITLPHSQTFVSLLKRLANTCKGPAKSYWLVKRKHLVGYDEHHSKVVRAYSPSHAQRVAMAGVIGDEGSLSWADIRLLDITNLDDIQDDRDILVATNKG